MATTRKTTIQCSKAPAVPVPTPVRMPCVGCLPRTLTDAAYACGVCGEAYCLQCTNARWLPGD